MTLFILWIRKKTGKHFLIWKWYSTQRQKINKSLTSCVGAQKINSGLAFRLPIFAVNPPHGYLRKLIRFSGKSTFSVSLLYWSIFIVAFKTVALEPSWCLSSSCLRWEGGGKAAHWMSLGRDSHQWPTGGMCPTGPLFSFKNSPNPFCLLLFPFFLSPSLSCLISLPRFSFSFLEQGLTVLPRLAPNSWVQVTILLQYSEKLELEAHITVLARRPFFKLIFSWNTFKERSQHPSCPVLFFSGQLYWLLLLLWPCRLEAVHLTYKILLLFNLHHDLERKTGHH